MRVSTHLRKNHLKCSFSFKVNFATAAEPAASFCWHGVVAAVSDGDGDSDGEVIIGDTMCHGDHLHELESLLDVARTGVASPREFQGGRPSGRHECSR